MNKITATGRLAADAEVKFTPSGDPVASFRLASDVGYGEKKTTNWFRCQIWGKRGEALAPYLTKGQQVTIFGTIILREWENKEGQKQISTDVRVDEVELQGGKREVNAPAQQRPSAPAKNVQSGPIDWPDFESDIPF